MSLLNMSLTGGVFILAVLLLRAAFQNIVPRRTFLVLWLAANALLLIPLRFRLSVSVYALVDRGTAEAAVQTAAANTMHTSAQVRALPWWRIVWIAGAALLLTVVLIAHGRNLLRFRRAVPVERQPEGVPDRVRVKVLPGLPSPLAYGLFRPTILIPSEDFAPPEQARHVYLHELCHIRHLDVARRYLMLFALAVHWFNPLVWVMYYVASQDMEMRCDEQAIRQLGAKKAYATTLVAMETSKMQHLLDAGFSFSSTGSRLKAILKARRLPVVSAVLALVLCVVTLTVFGTDAAKQAPAESPQTAVQPQKAEEAAPQPTSQAPAPQPEQPEPKPEPAPEPEAEKAEPAAPEPVQAAEQEEALPSSVPEPAWTYTQPAPQQDSPAPPAPAQDTAQADQTEQNAPSDPLEEFLPPAIPETDTDPVFTPIGTLDTTPPEVPFSLTDPEA